MAYVEYPNYVVDSIILHLNRAITNFRDIEYDQIDHPVAYQESCSTKFSPESYPK